MKLTAEEKELIVKKRAQEESQKPKKVGVLKHDLFYFSGRRPTVEIDVNDIVEKENWYFTKSSVEEIVNRCKKIFEEIQIPKGTICTCYIENGVESWFDDTGNIESYDEDWAKDNLENIKSIKGK